MDLLETILNEEAVTSAEDGNPWTMANYTGHVHITAVTRSHAERALVAFDAAWGLAMKLVTDTGYAFVNRVELGAEIGHAISPEGSWRGTVTVVLHRPPVEDGDQTIHLFDPEGAG